MKAPRPHVWLGLTFVLAAIAGGVLLGRPPSPPLFEAKDDPLDRALTEFHAEAGCASASCAREGEGIRCQCLGQAEAADRVTPVPMTEVAKPDGAVTLGAAPTTVDPEDLPPYKPFKFQGTFEELERLYGESLRRLNHLERSRAALIKAQQDLGATYQEIMARLEKAAADRPVITVPDSGRVRALEQALARYRADEALDLLYWRILRREGLTAQTEHVEIPR